MTKYNVKHLMLQQGKKRQMKKKWRRKNGLNFTNANLKLVETNAFENCDVRKNKIAAKALLVVLKDKTTEKKNGMK